MATVCGGSPGADGRRRAAQAAGLRHRHGPDPRRQGLRGALRHPRRRGSSRRHGLQGRRHLRRASPACRWTSRSPASPRRSCGSRSTRPRRAAPTSSARWPRRSTTRASELSAHAPRIETMQIDKAKIRDVIGTGGKVIREIVATTGAKVDIDDEGVIKISSSDRQPDRGGAPAGSPASSRRPKSARSRRQGRQHRRFRRVRELHGRQGRPRPRLRDQERAGREGRATSCPKARK